MEPILQVQHLTPLFNKPFNGIEVGLLARLETLRVMQDQVDVILMIKTFVDIGYSRFVVRDVLLEGESISAAIRNLSFHLTASFTPKTSLISEDFPHPV